jgi:hypothetical protein
MSRRIYSFFLIIASAVLLVSYSASGQTRSTALGNSSGAQDYVVSATLNQPYFDWLNEDVPYIISPEERGAFLQLIKDDARDRFMSNFGSDGIRILMRRTTRTNRSIIAGSFILMSTSPPEVPADGRRTAVGLTSSAASQTKSNRTKPLLRDTSRPGDIDT